jgi:carbon-monoxide dehydrogenase medium subunit
MEGVGSAPRYTNLGRTSEDIEYVAPKTLEHAVELLAANGERARVLAGGTDLLVQLRARRRSADVVVDVKQIPELTQLSYADESGLELGAAVPCYQIYRNEAVAAAYPGLIDAVSMIGGTQIQGRATVGGNLCNSAPSADAVPPLIVLSAVCKIAGRRTREVRAEEFCTAPGVTCWTRGAAGLASSSASSDRFGSYLRFIPRNEMTSLSPVWAAPWFSMILGSVYVG